jgi:hypothetical protein
VNLLPQRKPKGPSKRPPRPTLQAIQSFYALVFLGGICLPSLFASKLVIKFKVISDWKFDCFDYLPIRKEQ